MPMFKERGAPRTAPASVPATEGALMFLPGIHSWVQRKMVRAQNDGDIARATSIARVYTWLRPTDPHSWDFLARAHRWAGELELEGEALTKGVKCCPRSPRLRWSLGMWLAANGEFDQAAEELERAAKEFPESPFAYVGLAQIWARRDEAKAEAYCERALEVLNLDDLDGAYAYQEIALVFLRMRKIEKAIPMYKRLSKLFPNDPRAHLFLSFLLNDGGRGKEAREHQRLAREGWLGDEETFRAECDRLAKALQESGLPSVPPVAS